MRYEYNPAFENEDCNSVIEHFRIKITAYKMNKKYTTF